MARPVLSNSNRGFTLIEMMVAMAIILLALLGLVQAAFLSIDINLQNLIRDEAVRLAEEQMNMLKSLPISDTAYPSGLGATNNQALPPVTRNFGTFPANYAVYLTINNLTTDHSRKSIQVYVGWNFKSQSPTLQQPTNKEFQYMITSIVVNPQ